MPTIEQLLQEGSTKIVRGHIRKIVEIYDLEWRVAHELVQNAVDAIQAKDSIEHGEVKVTFNLNDDSITVTDNGIGFKRDHDLLRPGGTGEEKRLKSRSPTKGYQGVGLKAVMYSTDYFEIESETKSESWTFLSNGLRGYIDQDDPQIPEYAEEVGEADSGYTHTKIKAAFPKGTLTEFLNGLNRFLNADSVRWTSLYNKLKDELGHPPYEQYLSHFFEWYFRTQSYVGCSNSLLGIPVKDPDTGEYVHMKDMDIELGFELNDSIELEGPIGEWFSNLSASQFTTTVPYKAWDYAEISERNKQLPNKYNITPEIIQVKPNSNIWDQIKLRDKFLDLKLKPNEGKDNFRERYEDIIALLERPHSSVTAEDHKYAIEHITGIYLAIGRTSYFELMGITNHGMRIIASNGTPTAHDLIVRSTSSTWYLETIHCVINVDENLNIGKRHLANNMLVGRLRDFFEACYPKLVSMSKRLVKRDTSTSPTVPMPEVINLGKIEREGVSFKRFPADESSLVGLFSNAINKLYPDFSIYGLFRGATYDGKFSWNQDEVPSDSDLSKLEFKLRLDELTNEFDHAIHDKEFTEVSLVVVWDRRSNRDGWLVKGVSPDRRNQLESAGIPTDLINLVLEDGMGNARPLICVADLLQRIPLKEERTDDIDEFVQELG